MKPHPSLPIVGGILLAVLLVAVFGQRRRLEALRVELERPRTAESVVVEASPKVDPLTEEETRELLTLRRDVGQLRRQRLELDALRRTNARLRAAVVPDSPSSDGSGSVGPGKSYIRAREARYLGVATPSDTLESFLHAARNGDTNLLFQVLAAESVTNLTASPQGVESLRTEMGSMPGFRIRSVEEQPDGTVKASIQVDPRRDSDPWELELERAGDGWRLRL